MSHHNLPIPKLIQLAVDNREGVILKNGALAVSTGKRTGRSPRDKFIVKDALTADKVAWGKHNQPIAPSYFDQLWADSERYIKGKSLYTAELHCGASTQHYQPLLVENELAWHNVFCQSLFIRPPEFNPKNKPKWQLRSLPNFHAVPAVHGTHSEGAVMLNFSQRKVLIVGIAYAGEMKKSMFSVLNFLLPEVGILPMHCAANVGGGGDVSLFFGLSGTGKTTLSADPTRQLIGDDEHGWGEDGVFNFEGGCYAKAINLSQKNEPVIWQAIKDGSVIENAVFDPSSGEVDYTDDSLTENIRVVYPLDHVDNQVAANAGGAANNIIFLTCDLTGVLPPVAILNRAQAAYHFISGYTAKVGSTEVGASKAIDTTFSHCYGAPFFPHPVSVYANLLMRYIERCQSNVFLVNSGWTGGPYGVGRRFDIPVTRSIIHAIQSGGILDAPTAHLPTLNLDIPTQLSGVATELLNPANTWGDASEYNRAAAALARQFADNIAQFELSSDIIAAGPMTAN